MRLSILFAFIITGATLTGCQHQGQPSLPDYLLPSAGTTAQCGLTVQLSLAGYLDQGGIIYQTSASEYRAARHHRWAESLAMQLQRSLTAEACQQGIDTGTLRVTVSRFHAQTMNQQDNAVLTASWHYRQGADNRYGQTTTAAPLSESGYDHLVIQLDEQWRNAMATVVTSITNTSAEQTP